jgi:dihydrofolate synthase/folylpolyglutamate synthase
MAPRSPTARGRTISAANAALEAAVEATLARLAQLHPNAIEPGLERIARLLDALGRPQLKSPPVIHIAGTNGKGSVAAMLAAVARASGLAVHVYTSPHLVRFNERIRLSGAPIEDEPLLALLERVEAVNDGAPITFFEITTAAAFLAFADSRADLVILETGLGGRFDATNVIPRPACAVITTVGLDHMEYLGFELAQIASEKAGILKAGAPAVIGPQEPEARAALAEEALRLGVAAKFWGRDYVAREENGRLIYEAESRVLDLPRPRLIGGHQIANAGAVIAAALEVFDADDVSLSEGLSTAQWPARLEKIERGPLLTLTFPETPGELWIDGAHNPMGAAALARALADIDDKAPRPLVIVMGLLRSKDAPGVLAPFHGLARGVVCAPLSTTTNGMDPRALADVADDLGLDAEPASSLEAALAMAADFVADDEPAPRVVICGSLYLAGEALAMNEGRTRTATAG